MVAITTPNPAPAGPVNAPHSPDVAARPARHVGLIPTASMIVGAAVAVVWLWIPLTILVVGISSIPSVIGFALAVVVFVYLMRGVEWIERIRSEAVFEMGIPVPPRNISPYAAAQAISGERRHRRGQWVDGGSRAADDRPQQRGRGDHRDPGPATSSSTTSARRFRRATVRAAPCGVSGHR
jgi:hypothetical protein